jgi:hypothetical protein
MKASYTDQMASRRLAATIALVALMTAARPAAPVAQAIQRSLHVSVLDKAGKVVPDLGVSDFIVREDKVAREVLRVRPANAPMQIALLVDDSQAAAEYIVDYRNAITAFITDIAGDKAVDGKHSIAIVTLASRPTINTNYTSDQASLLKGAQRIFSQSGTGTCLLDGIAEISEGIIKRHSASPVIVAITTEGVELSDRSYIQVLDVLRDSGAALHVVAVGTIRNSSPDRSRVLSEGTQNSGGRYDNILTSRSLTDKMKQVAFELTHQYLVTYAHPQSLIPPDKVTVSAARPDLTVRGTLVRDEIEERK